MAAKDEYVNNAGKHPALACPFLSPQMVWVNLNQNDFRPGPPSPGPGGGGPRAGLILRADQQNLKGRPAEPLPIRVAFELQWAGPRLSRIRSLLAIQSYGKSVVVAGLGPWPRAARTAGLLGLGHWQVVMGVGRFCVVEPVPTVLGQGRGGAGAAGEGVPRGMHLDGRELQRVPLQAIEAAGIRSHRGSGR